VSWLKKNELDLKRHVTELRETIRNNWTTTGQELSREIRQFWSRPGSPAPRSLRSRQSETDVRAASSSARSPLGRLMDNSRSESPGLQNDFATGYSLGLIGGVRSWMTRTRSRRGDQPSSSDSDDEAAEPKSPQDETSPVLRGRKGKRDGSERYGESQVEMDTTR